MDIANVYPKSRKHSNKAVRAGRVISALCILFLLFDGGIKLLNNPYAIEASAKLGWSQDLLPALGIILIISTILYSIPRTAFIGAVLLTAYLGGATATMVRVGEPLFFSVIFGMLVWLGLALRDARIRSLFSFSKQ